MSGQPAKRLRSWSSGAEVVLRALEAQGVELLFGYPGGAILPIYDALPESPLRHILCRHEQGAALAADGYARATGRVGVCLATSGPGATNLVTGLANALLDSVPMVAITGQVPTSVMGTDAFQEVDTLGMTLPVVKHSFLVRDPEDLSSVIAEAFRIARSGRPGPVLVDLPKDVQLAELRSPCRWAVAESQPVVLSSVDLGPALALLQSARRPVVYAGGGVGMAGAVSEFRTFVETAGIPTVTTLKGLGLLPPGHSLNLGLLGMHGLEAANHSVQGSDLLVVLGARFDDRVTGKLAAFAPRARVLHIDVDAAELGKIRAADVAIAEDLKPVLKRLNHLVDRSLDIEDWRGSCAASMETHAWDYDPPHDRVYAPRFLRALSAAQGPDGVISCDVGQHQMWVAQHCGVHRPENHLSSGGLGTMGYGLPAAIGAQLGRPDASVVNVSGDGSFMMNVQELATLHRYQLPVKIVLLDNSCLGMVRQWQELFLDKRYSETDLSDNPDFCMVGRAFGLTSFRIWNKDQEAEAIERLLATDGPALVHVVLDPGANVWPFVAPGQPNSKMMRGADR
jgi:acetolactate synthase-1/2/3 large subunit